ncbi:Glycosyl hydrolases family 16 [Seinonella peptonophila]|uniref:Glycosyl hydrolases family 16 n=1 Tax=Seinonella peptonophila TaxID=112248 RepID=A0A1M4TZZ8_9BACL|nr:glycoside hydrolase family 16 protein [Seinonella peptonophila]SHE50010.1 Glycosyl hydrolases family 16 [Seinonella peptonophila]
MRKWVFLFSLIGLIALSIFSSIPKNFTAITKTTEDHNTYIEKKLPTITTNSGVWEQVFIDDFQSNQLNKNKWTSLFQKDNYNEELQFYTPKNVNLSNGFLNLTAKKERKQGKLYTSGLVNMKDKFTFLYGRVDIRMKVPFKPGMLPALWLLPANNQLPEVDIFEAPGLEPKRVYMVNHWRKKGELVSKSTFYDLRYPNKFHTYTLEWEKNELRWYIDDIFMRKTNQGVPQERMYLILNLAVGGKWPGSPKKSTTFPITMQIDSVKIYKKKAE